MTTAEADIQMGFVLAQSEYDRAENSDSFPLRTPVAYGVRSTICVCGHDTLSTCKECGSPACGDCLDTVAHDLRFHKTAA